jgi:nucleoporin SEH1
MPGGVATGSMPPPSPSSIQRFRSGHDAYLHDVALDFYGKRLATCSVDRSIRIWDRTDTSPSGWKLVATLPDAHHAPVLKLSWAHPEFGQGVLASCSSDCFVHVYEEVPVPGSQQKKWMRRAAHADAKDEVTDVQFAPSHLGLKLASCSKDGVVRVYEAYDIVNLSMWQLQQEFMVNDAGECTSLSWSSSMFDALPLLVIGTKKNGASVWQFAPEARTFKNIAQLSVNVKPRSSIAGTSSHMVLDVDWAPNIGRPYHLIATGSADGYVRIYKLVIEDGYVAIQSHSEF